jgi:cobalt/nickel transport protein
MNRGTKGIIIGGLACALLIAVLSPYIASTNPDGLGATAQHLNPKLWNSSSNDFANPGYWHAPFENYEIWQIGGKLGGILALILGLFIAMGVALGVTEIIKRKKRNDAKLMEINKSDAK